MIAARDVAIQVQIVGIVFQRFLRSLDGSGIIVVEHVQDDHVAPAVGIGGVDVKAVTQLLDGPLVIFLGEEILAVELVYLGLVGMLLDENREQVVDALGGILLGHPVADVGQQHAQLGVHIKLLGGERVVDLLLIACTVAGLIAILGAGQIDDAVVRSQFLGAIQVVEGAVGHVIMLEQAAHRQVVGIVLRGGGEQVAHLLDGSHAVVHRHVVLDFARRDLDCVAEDGRDAVIGDVALLVVARVGIGLGEAHLQFQTVGIAFIELLEGTQGLVGVPQLHVGIAVEGGLIQVAGPRLKVFFHQRQSLFAALLGRVAHLQQAHAHVK